MYSYIKCLIDLGRTKEAKEKLDFINKGSYHLIGEIEIADLYVELDCYNEAIEWFEKGYNAYSGSSYWISRFVYALYKTNNFSRLDEVIKEEIEETNKAIMQEEVNENWTEAQKRDAIENYTREYNYYKQLKERITSGYVPQLQFSAPFTSACYLFGCKRQGNPEYQG